MVTKTEQCFGCTACASVCPVKAIKMEADQEGFAYPKVEQEQCIGCNLCEKACPLNQEKAGTICINTYAMQHKNADVLRESTSGGMYTALSDAVLKEAGVVYGAAFDENLKVCHIRATTNEERDRCRGSKYVQSNLGDTFSQVQKDLFAGRKVLFFGTPCQVDGLRSFLRKEYDNLFLCDLICNGVTSPAVWKEHVAMLNKVNRSNVVQYKFRPKTWGWTIHNEMAILENGKLCHSNAYATIYRELYYSRLLHRPSCYGCRYTNLNRVSDITIADCRGIEHRDTQFDVEAGMSLVLINSAKGVRLFSEIQENILCEEIKIEEFMQPPLKHPAQKPDHRELFWKEFRDRGYWRAVLAVRGKNYVLKHTVKQWLSKCGIRL